MTADHSELKQDIVAYVAGDDAAGDRVCATLDRAVREAVCGFFPPQDADREDIIQDSLLAMLEYLRRAEDCPDNPEAFAVTIALNRCRNLHQWRKRRPTIDIDDAAPWLPGDAENPLDRLHDEQVRAMLADAFARLDDECRELLFAIYLEERSVEELRREAGLASVQGIYHRKNICFKKVTQLFNRSWFSGRYSRRGKR